MIDLHIHTIYSDGSFTPQQVVSSAASNGVDVLAVTDHDSVEGLPEASAACEGAKITFVTGTELTVYHDEQEVHILGYFIDATQKRFRELLDTLRAHRMERMKRMMEIMAALGKSVTMEQVRGDASGSIGRPHLARALVDSGACGSVDEAFRTYLAQGQPAYVRKFMMPIRDGIEHVKRAGGIAVMAHPGISSVSDDVIVRARGWGLDGIEAYHCDHSARQVRHYRELAERVGLVVTGGSDFHGGKIREHSTIGYPRVPDEIYRKMLEYRDHGGA